MMCCRATVSGDKDFVLPTLSLEDLECLNKQISFILLKRKKRLVLKDTIQTD